jgi:hypothetical protein
MSGTSSGSRKDPPIVIQNTEVAAPRAAARAAMTIRSRPAR